MGDKYLLAPEIRASTYEQAITTFCLLFSKIKIIPVKCFLLLGVQLCFHRFFPFEALFLKSDYLFMIQSTVRLQLLLFSIFLTIFGYRLENTIRLLRWSTNRSIFWLLHNSGNADEPGRVSSIETNGSRKEQRLESTWASAAVFFKWEQEIKTSCKWREFGPKTDIFGRE